MTQAQFVKISEEELEFLTGSSEPRAALDHLWHDDMKLMVMTRGAAGCTYITPDFIGNVPGFKVTAVDATGAGDGFVAGLLQGLIKDPTVISDESALKTLCRFANAVGAITSTERGAIPSLPDREQIQRFLQSHNQTG